MTIRREPKVIQIFAIRAIGNATAIIRSMITAVFQFCGSSLNFIYHAPFISFFRSGMKSSYRMHLLQWGQYVLPKQNSAVLRVRVLCTGRYEDARRRVYSVPRALLPYRVCIRCQVIQRRGNLQ